MAQARFTPPNGGLLIFDVADRNTDRFICTMRMPFNPMSKLSIKDVFKFVYEKRPSLKNRKITIEL